MGLSVNFQPSTPSNPAAFTMFMRQYNVGAHQLLSLSPYCFPG